MIESRAYVQRICVIFTTPTMRLTIRPFFDPPKLDGRQTLDNVLRKGDKTRHRYHINKGDKMQVFRIKVLLRSGRWRGSQHRWLEGGKARSRAKD